MAVDFIANGRQFPHSGPTQGQSRLIPLQIFMVTIPTAPSSFWARSLAKTRVLFEKIGVANAPWSEADYQQCEESLLLADVGAPASARLIQSLKDDVDKNRPISSALSQAIAQLIAPLEAPPWALNTDKPQVLLMVGINGCGKTTTIAKITRYLLQQQKSVILAAGDTFRAAAREQLRHWGEISAVRVVEQSGGDPASVAFSAIQSALASQTDCAIIDTAGRLPTQKHLMAELARIHRVCGKALAGAPHEVWLVLDGTQGQNTLTQIQQFHEYLPLSGLIITKLDGSAKGGFVVALAHEIVGKNHKIAKVPIRFVGVGEKADDLEVFSAKNFANALVGCP